MISSAALAKAGAKAIGLGGGATAPPGTPGRGAAGAGTVGSGMAVTFVAAAATGIGGALMGGTARFWGMTAFVPRNGTFGRGGAIALMGTPVALVARSARKRSRIASTLLVVPALALVLVV